MRRTSTGHHSRKTKHGMACRCLTVLYFPFSLSTPFRAFRFAPRPALRAAPRALPDVGRCAPPGPQGCAPCGLSATGPGCWPTRKKSACRIRLCAPLKKSVIALFEDSAMSYAITLDGLGLHYYGGDVYGWGEYSSTTGATAVVMQALAFWAARRSRRLDAIAACLLCWCRNH